MKRNLFTTVSPWLLFREELTAYARTTAGAGMHPFVLERLFLWSNFDRLSPKGQRAVQAVTPAGWLRDGMREQAAFVVGFMAESRHAWDRRQSKRFRILLWLLEHQTAVDSYGRAVYRDRLSSEELADAIGSGVTPADVRQGLVQLRNALAST